MCNKFSFAFALVLIFISSGCGWWNEPTYKKEQIPESIQKICKEEYGLTEKVEVKISGKTLGVRVHFEDLLDMSFKLQEKALEKFQDVLKVIRRVCLSTDAEFDYFIIVGLEKKIGIEVVFYSYIDDLKRVMAGWMSPEDYFQRMVKSMQLDTLRWGDTRMSKLIKDIEARSVVKILMGNFALGTTPGNLSPDFLKMLSDLGKKTYVKWFVQVTKSVQTDWQERLYYIEAKEYYTPKAEEAENLSYPSGVIHKYYILMGIEDMNPVVKSVYTKEELPKKYADLGDPLLWKENEFFVEDFVFHKFLSTQIVQRIQYKLTDPEKIKRSENDEKELEKKLPAFTMKGDFIVPDGVNMNAKIEDASKNIFKLSFSAKKGKKLELPKDVIDLSVNTVKEVCDKYKFYDVGEIQLMDDKDNIIYSAVKKDIFDKR